MVFAGALCPRRRPETHRKRSRNLEGIIFEQGLKNYFFEKKRFFMIFSDFLVIFDDFSDFGTPWELSDGDPELWITFFPKVSDKP